MSKTPPKLRFHKSSCGNCRYYRIHEDTSECLLLGRTLSMRDGCFYHDQSRVCDSWKKRPKNWNYAVELNPHWYDQYIPRETLLRLRKSKGIK